VLICSAPFVRHAAWAALALPYADTEAMQLHLDEISRMGARGAHVVLLLDRAGWHTTGHLTIPKNMTLIFLPSRAPELNPAENVWQHLRQTWLSNRVFDTYKAIIDAACEPWNRLMDQPQAITSIGLFRPTRYMVGRRSSDLIASCRSIPVVLSARDAITTCARFESHTRRLDHGSSTATGGALRYQPH